jgi:hypothetical protein
MFTNIKTRTMIMMIENIEKFQHYIHIHRKKEIENKLFEVRKNLLA